MDLMNGYGSSSDEDEETNQQAQPKHEPQRKPAPTEASQGKKLLKLASVLPPHILQQLTNPNFADDDESSDEDDNYQTNGTAHKQNHSTTTEVSNLLNDLHKLSPTSGRDYTTLGFKQNDAPTETTANKKKEKPLGAALVETVVETVAQDNSVRNIHAAPKAPPPPASQDDTEIMDRKPPPTTRLVRPRVQAAPRVSAAPPVPLASTEAVATAPYPPTAAAANGQNNNDYASQKKRKQQLERALRNQEVGQVWQDDQLADRHGVAPTAHAPAIPNVQPPAVESRFQNVPQKWCGYNPDTKTLSKTGKGKNQISYVLAQAVQLEQQRLEQGGNNAKNPHRANAKRKYGW